jgi:Acyl-CoA synthetases (AMP-forming)/AMP-acid ligases II
MELPRGTRYRCRPWRELARGGRVGRDRVAILCANRLETLEIILGCGWIGAIAVPINTAAMGPQIGYYLSNSGAACL